MTRLTLLVVLLSANLIAQISEGPFVGVPMLTTIGGNTLGPAGSVLASGQIYIKRAGFTDIEVATPFSATRPVFTRNAMFGAPATLPMGFRLDAISSGFHVIWANYNGSGQPVLPASLGGNWGALIYSITRNSPGTGDMLVENEASKPEGAGADVFSWVLPGSTLPSSLACVPIGEAQRATDSSEAGLMFAAGMQPDLKDFDVFLPFYEVQGSVLALLEPQPWVYFSLPSTVAADPSIASWFSMRNGVAIPAPGNTPSGATILRIRWSTASMTWSTPQVYATWQELGFQVSDDVDALSVEEDINRVLVSLRAAPVAQQLMVATLNSGSWIPARPYLYDDGTDALALIAEKVGAGGGGDIDATCEPDPSDDNGVARGGFGYIVDCREGLPFPATIASSAIVTSSASPADTTVAVSASGLSNTSGISIGALLAGRPPSSGATASMFVTLDVFLVGSSTRTHHWTFPAMAAAYGIEIDFQWITVDGPVISLSTVSRGRF